MVIFKNLCCRNFSINNFTKNTITHIIQPLNNSLYGKIIQTIIKGLYDMSDCIFCKIINGEIPAAKVFENDHVLAFLDISQVTKGHTLVIPKVHKENLFELTPEVAKNIFEVVPSIAKALKTTFEPVGLNTVNNN